MPNYPKQTQAKNTPGLRQFIQVAPAQNTSKIVLRFGDEDLLTGEACLRSVDKRLRFGDDDQLTGDGHLRFGDDNQLTGDEHLRIGEDDHLARDTYLRFGEGWPAKINSINLFKLSFFGIRGSIIARCQITNLTF